MGLLLPIPGRSTPKPAATLTMGLSKALGGEHSCQGCCKKKIYDVMVQCCKQS